MKDKTLIALMFGLLAGMVFAQSGSLSAQAAPVVGCQEAKTIFRDSSRFSRRGNAAQNMTEKHDEYTRNGWKFEDMEPYIENGDLEGFFLTYSRDIACGETD
jgi:hypothetical protein